MDCLNRGSFVAFGILLFNFVLGKSIPCTYLELFVPPESKCKVKNIAHFLHSSSHKYRCVKRVSGIRRVTFNGAVLVFNLESFQASKDAPPTNPQTINVYYSVDKTTILDFVSSMSASCHMPYYTSRRLVFPTHILQHRVVNFGDLASESREILEEHGVTIELPDQSGSRDFSYTTFGHSESTEPVSAVHSDATFDTFLAKIQKMTARMAQTTIDLLEQHVSIANPSFSGTLGATSIAVAKHPSILQCVDARVRELLGWPSDAYTLSISLDNEQVHVSFGFELGDVLVASDDEPRPTSRFFQQIRQDLRDNIQTVAQTILRQFEVDINNGLFDISVCLDNPTWAAMFKDQYVLDHIEDLFLSATKWPSRVVRMEFDAPILYIRISVDTIVDDFCLI
ncbi:hypothetical protein GGF31_003462 [Allomyces arbusculus]|nr:hypothetical protein GGF31_003462 [Allomyces arbusculus]